MMQAMTILLWESTASVIIVCLANTDSTYECQKINKWDCNYMMKLQSFFCGLNHKKIDKA